MVREQETMRGILGLLADGRHISQEDIETIVADFHGNDTEYFEDFLVEEGIVEKDALLRAMGEYFNVRPVDVLGEVFDHDLLAKFPREVLLENVCLPYYRDGNLLFVISHAPYKEGIESALREYVSYDIEFFVGIPGHIELMIYDFYQEPLYENSYEDTIEEAAEEE